MTAHEYDKELAAAEDIQTEEDDFSETPPSDIVAFNELRSCADLVRMHEKNQLVIKPDFQRDVVWKNPAQTRFIDSLVKQLPIPSMCLSLDYKTEKRLMIDGLQRISSVIKFLTDDTWRLSSLDDIDSRIAGRTPGHIKEKYNDIYSRIENLTIPVTVLRCDYSKKSHMHYLFTIFHRLNTGGNKLSNQEIRNCIFQGGFNDLLRNLTNDKNTRALFSLKADESYRFSYEELFLRAFTFSHELEEYSGRLAKYLNNYMNGARSFDQDKLSDMEERMKRAIDILYSRIMDGKALPRLSKATTESILVGLYKNIENLETESNSSLRKRFTAVRKDSNFSLDSLKEGLSATEKVKSRINKASELFA